MRSFRTPSLLALAGGLALVAVGCGASGQSKTVTVIEKTVVEKAGAADAPAGDAAAEDRVDSEPASASGSGSGKIRVPDVVGKDHQLAQDTMQAAGLYNLAEEDATGQGRALLWDRNWVVVGQSPPAGTLVNEDQTVVLRSKKKGE